MSADSRDVKNTHPSNNAGFRACRRTGPDSPHYPGRKDRRSWVTVYSAMEAEMCPHDTWVVVCEQHGGLVGIDTRRHAETIMRNGSTSFCEECREATP